MSLAGLKAHPISHRHKMEIHFSAVPCFPLAISQPQCGMAGNKKKKKTSCQLYYAHLSHYTCSVFVCMCVCAQWQSSWNLLLYAINISLSCSPGFSQTHGCGRLNVSKAYFIYPSSYKFERNLMKPNVFVGFHTSWVIKKEKKCQSVLHIAFTSTITSHQLCWKGNNIYFWLHVL